MVFDQHDLAPELFRVKFGTGSPIVRAVEWMEKRTFRVANVVLAPTSRTARWP